MGWITSQHLCTTAGETDSLCIGQWLQGIIRPWISDTTKQQKILYFSITSTVSFFRWHVNVKHYLLVQKCFFTNKNYVAFCLRVRLDSHTIEYFFFFKYTNVNNIVITRQVISVCQLLSTFAGQNPLSANLCETHRFSTFCRVS